MAHNESDREDLMGEATALVRRIEISIDDHFERIVAGFRKTGMLSLYFDADPVYHLDEQMRLRRAYDDGFLYRTQGATLAQLDRQRTKTTTTLNRHDLSDTELKRFCDTVTSNIQYLLEVIQKDRITIHQQIPADAPMLEELQAALQRALAKGIQLAPAIAGKK